MIQDQSSRHSTLRERIVEHIFIGELLRRLWQLGITNVEVLRSEFDAGGYDLVLSRGSIIRHIQLKSITDAGKAKHTKISIKLEKLPSACVIWIIMTASLEPKTYLWFGSEPGQRLPDISTLKIARHTKGNAHGIKAERPDHRTLPRRAFTELNSIDAVLQRLFGVLDGTV